MQIEGRSGGDLLPNFYSHPLFVVGQVTNFVLEATMDMIDLIT